MTDRRREEGGERQVDRRAGEGHRDLAPWLDRDLLDPRHAADRQQGDIAHADAVVERHEAMPEFVEDDEGEEEGHQDQAETDAEQPVATEVAPVQDDPRQRRAGTSGAP